MKKLYERIDESGENLLRALGYTGKIAEMTQSQICAILSLQKPYFLIVQEEGKQPEIFLPGKRKQGGHLSQKKIREILFGKQTLSL